jgi:hypothetical protein
MKTSLLCLVLATLGLASCSSIKSVEAPSKGGADGLTYFMPKRDFLVTITTTDKGAVEKVSLGSTAAYPDLSKQYLLRHGSNVFGKNTLDVGISESGLLTSAKSTTQSNVSDAFKGLATTLGLAKAPIMALRDKGDKKCATKGDHTFVLKSAEPDTYCGVKITITKQEINPKVLPHDRAENEEHSGIFYRQDIPYLMVAEGVGVNAASIVFSPSDSPTHFLPISQTFFSNNEADFGFKDGIPTKYKQDTEGEAVALLKLPADIFGAYFAAMGTVFDSFKTRDSKEAAALAESLKLELAKKKYDACIAAIKANDDPKIKELACQ